IQATASEIQTYYNKIISEKPSWNDLLDGSSNANGWDIFNANHGAEQCGFSEGAYHAYARQDKVVGECFARVPTFNNFIYRVQMYVVEGDSGGIIFRSKTPNYNSVMYRFHLSVLNNGSYDVYRSYNNNQGDNFACGGIQVDYCPSTTIIAGVHETNYLSVMAKGSKMYFFVNNLLIFWITDSTSSTGYIGLFANDKPDTTDVQFNNAEVWKL
nr:DUF1080 domain-containing protein [Chloroflexota bacterium]